MSTVSTVTIGANTYDVYGTESELDTYMRAKLGADAFFDASGNDRRRAHVMATRWMDRQRWKSVPTDTTTPQPLEHPRVGLLDCNGTAVPDNQLAPGICEGTFELVLAILEDPTIVNKSLATGSNVKRAKAGSAEVEFFQPGRDSSGSKGTIFPTAAFQLISCYLRRQTGGVETYGTGAKSSFTDCDRFGLNEGYK